jgi:hypothetical protein
LKKGFGAIQMGFVDRIEVRDVSLKGGIVPEVDKFFEGRWLKGNLVNAIND